MTYTDAQGRPEILMHPDILRGQAAYRFLEPTRPVESEGASEAPEAASGPQVPADAAGPGPRPRAGA